MKICWRKQAESRTEWQQITEQAKTVVMPREEDEEKGK
jgi:hypothetical protein